MENLTASQIDLPAGRQDLRQSPEYGRYIESLGWVVEKITNNKQHISVFIRKLRLMGAIAKIQRFDDFPWEKIRPILKKHHVWMTKVEPNWQLSTVNCQLPGGFRQDNWPMLATKTLRIDLQPTLENIRASFKKDCRYILRKLDTEHWSPVTNNFDDFYVIWERAAGIKKLWIPPRKDYASLVSSFGKKCFCITVDGQAGCLVLIHDETAYYYYSGALPKGKSKNLPYLVVWESMQRAKQLKCKVWDFEGIFDARWPNKGWKGFTHFKKSFGGKEIEFIGSFTKWGLIV